MEERKQNRWRHLATSRDRSLEWHVLEEYVIPNSPPDAFHILQGLPIRPYWSFSLYYTDFSGRYRVGVSLGWPDIGSYPLRHNIGDRTVLRSTDWESESIL